MWSHMLFLFLQKKFSTYNATFLEVFSDIAQYEFDCRVFVGLNITSILYAIIIEECILPEVNVYFLATNPEVIVVAWRYQTESDPSNCHPSIYPDFQIQQIICSFFSPHSHLINGNTETKSFPNNQTGPQDIATAVAHDSIISRKRYSKSVISQLKQTYCILNASDG